MTNRRDFMKHTALASAIAAAPSIVSAQGAAREFKIGLVGSGGRGKGATDQLIKAAKMLGQKAKVVAVADFFLGRAQGAAKQFGCDQKYAFGGGDSYKKVMESDCDIVVFGAPPYVRPIHTLAAVAAGKHVFAEKPVAVDPVGVRQFLQAAEEAKKKKLSIVAGTQRRHQYSYLRQAQLLAEGKVGPILGGAIYWNGNVPFVRVREEGESNAAYLAANWVNWTEINGDHIVEQHVHNIDVANWFMGRYPKMACGYGGRARRVSGNQYDFFSIDFDFGDGVHIHSMCRQMAGTSHRVGEEFRTADEFISGGGKIMRGKEAIALPEIKKLNFVTDQNEENPYVLEHANLLNGILTGDVLNEGENVAMSTACGIMGRISAYTGQTVRLSDLLTNKDSAFYNMNATPAAIDFEGEADVKMPGPENVAPVPGKVDDRFANLKI